MEVLKYVVIGLIGFFSALIYQKYSQSQTVKKEIEVKNYSFSAGQYFEVKIEHVDITPEEFAFKMKAFESNLESLFAESKSLEMEIQNNLKGLKYE